MPLQNEPPPKIWHWSQAIAWIAFDIENPIAGTYRDNKLSATHEPEIEGRARQAASQLIGKVIKRELHRVLSRQEQQSLMDPSWLQPPRARAWSPPLLAPPFQSLSFLSPDRLNQLTPGEIYESIDYLVNRFIAGRDSLNLDGHGVQVFKDIRFLRQDILDLWPDDSGAALLEPVYQVADEPTTKSETTNPTPTVSKIESFIKNEGAVPDNPVWGLSWGPCARAV